MKRPLIQVALFYVAGILLAQFIALDPWPLLYISIGTALFALFWGRVRTVLLCALLVLSGWTNLTLQRAVISPEDLRRILPEEPQLVTVRGRLCETPSLRVQQHGENPSWHTLARLEATALRLNRREWQPAFGRIAVMTPGLLTNFFAGQTVEISGVARPPPFAVAEGIFDYRAYLRQQGIYFQLHAPMEEDWQVITSPTRRPLADRFRAWGQQALALGLPEEDETLRLEWALTLGWKPALTEEVSEPFVRAATYHIFAVDGLRMALVFGILFALLRAVGVPRGIGGAVLIPWIWFYTALTGWPASAIRATVMLTVVIGGWVLRRPNDLINSLFAAAFIILLWEPQQLFQAGFQLSFCVVLCIILIMPILQGLWHRLTAPDPLLPDQLRPRWQKALRVPLAYVADTLLTSFAAWIGSLPLVAYYFNILTPVSTPANLLAVPLCALVLVSNLASLLLAGWFPGAAIVFNHGGWFLMECIRVSSHWFAELPRAYWYVKAPSVLTCVLYYLVLLAALTGWLFGRRWTGSAGIPAGGGSSGAGSPPPTSGNSPSGILAIPVFWRWAALVLGLLIWGWQYLREASSTTLHILPLNGGVAVFSDSPGKRKDLLVDCGPTNTVPFITKPFLRAQGVNRLPNLVLTHGDSHHVAAAEQIADLFRAEHVCVSPARFRSPVYRQVLKDFSQKPGLVRTISRDHRVGPWTILHPEPTDSFSYADDNALVLFGTFGHTRVLLLSDLGRPGQEALLERMPDLRADIVVTGLPTQNEAVGETLLDALKPGIIIVADSEFPASERASPRLRGRLSHRGVPVIYTRFDGAAVIELDKSGWKLRTMSGTRLSNPR